MFQCCGCNIALKLTCWELKDIILARLDEGVIDQLVSDWVEDGYDSFKCQLDVSLGSAHD